MKNVTTLPFTDATLGTDVLLKYHKCFKEFVRIEADVFYEKPDAKYEKDVTENQFILPLTRVDNGGTEN